MTCFSRQERTFPMIVGHVSILLLCRFDFFFFSNIFSSDFYRYFSFLNFLFFQQNLFFFLSFQLITILLDMRHFSLLCCFSFSNFRNVSSARLTVNLTHAQKKTKYLQWKSSSINFCLLGARISAVLFILLNQLFALHGDFNFIINSVKYLIFTKMMT